jgi:2-dehydro-3-deoxy-D-gluconate 5-dehydrogenase
MTAGEGSRSVPGVLDAFRLDGKVALVSGASAGLGAAIAVALAEAGADVVCHGNTRTPESTCELVRQRGRRTAAVLGDLGRRETPARLMDQALSHFSRIDILVNNAGTIRRAPAVDYSEEDWDLVLQVNLSAVFRLSQLMARHVMADERRRGKIINIASLLSFQGGITVPAYAASKGGLAQLTKALANEWAPRLNVNGIAPGYMRTDNTLALQKDETRSRQILERIPAGRWGEPADLGGAAVFLASTASDYVHGHVLAADGGWLGR